MKIFQLILLFFLNTCALQLLAQEPTYQIVGEDFFAEMDVYSLLQDQEENIWIATDKGLVKYDSKKFVLLTNKSLKNSSLFGLVKNDKGKIFCYNLSGQILTVEQDSLHLYFQIPDSLLSNGLNINIDDNNQVFVSAKHFFVLDQYKQIKIVHDLSYSHSIIKTSSIGKNKDNTLVFIANINNQIANFKNNEFILKETIETNLPSSSNRCQILCNKEYEIATLTNVNKIFKKIGQEWKEFANSTQYGFNSKIGNCFFSNKNHIWITYINNGAAVLDMEGKSLFGARKILEKYRISAILEDREGNLWLGTFGKGLLLIPNLNCINFSSNGLFSQEELGCLALGTKSLFASAQKGNIFKLDSLNQIHAVTKIEEDAIKELFYLKASNELLVNNNWLDLNTFKVNAIKDCGSVKDVQQISRNEVLVATNIGIFYERKNFLKDTVVSFLNSYKTNKLEQFKKLLSGTRINCLFYDANEKHIWVGTSNGVQIVYSDTMLKVEHNKNPIVAKSITQLGKQIYIATRQGIFVFEGSHYVRIFRTSEGLLSDNISKIKPFGDYLFIASDKGFQRYNPKNQQFKNFELSDGLLSNKILDFEIQGDTVWLLSSKGLQCFQFEQLNQEKIKLNLAFVSVKINDRSLDWTKKKDFAYNQNKIEFEFIAKSYRNKTTLTYFYKLDGFHENWQKNNFDNNKVIFNALSSGDYTFLVKAQDSKNNQSIILSYSFTIAPPFWQTGWFLFLCALGIILLVTIFFLFRINILKRENKLQIEKQEIEKELIESRQAALRSQMNPHFLFNALNSIQEMIMVNEKREAGKYLGKFADLMRIYLNHSRQNTIKLSEELEALSLYLELEKVRFEDSLKIDWKVDEQIDTNGIMIPSMLIQPYIENALKHGLLHRAKNRLLKVYFQQDINKNILICTVEDNGIGRIQSAAINKIRNPEHQSFATSATQKRLELLNNGLKNPISVQIIDLKDEQKESLGTRVIICIPIDFGSLGS